jgi:tetratricopeptide (TPR) repeat protein
MSQAIDHEIRVLRAQFWSSRDPEGRAFAPLADAYRRKGDLEEAAALVEDGLARLPEFTPGHLISARIARARGDLDTARRELDQLLELDHENVLALLERAEVARDTGDRESAVADLQHLLVLEPAHLGARAALDRLESAPPQLDRETETVETDEAAPEETILEASPQEHDEGESAVLSGLESTSLDEEPEGGFEALEEARDEEEPEEEEFAVETLESHGTLLDFDEASFDELDGGTAGLMEPREDDGIELGDLAFTGALDDESLDPSGEVGPPAHTEAEDAADEADPPPDTEAEHAVSGEKAEPAPSDPVTISGFEAPEEAPASPAGDIPAHLMTRTMAEIYRQQGLTARAVRIYEALRERNPDDEEISVRLAELREAERKREDAEPELQDVAPQWAGDEDVAEEPSSPFAWGPEMDESEVEDDETAPEEGTGSGRSIRDHFDDLLAWAPGAVPISDLSPDAAPERAPYDSPLARSLREKEATAGVDGRGGGAPGVDPDSGDDEDLDDFRSWLQSLDS